MTSEAASPDHRSRMKAGQELAAREDLAPVEDTLMALLLDRDDTAVTLATAESLLARGDEAGLRLVGRALILAGDDSAVDRLADAVHDHPNGGGSVSSARRWRSSARSGGCRNHP